MKVYINGKELPEEEKGKKVKIEDVEPNLSKIDNLLLQKYNKIINERTKK